MNETYTYMMPQTQSFQEVCNLNQMALVESTSKMPIILLWLASLTFLFLLIHFWIIPLLYKWKYYSYITESFSGFAFVTSIFMVLFTILLTVQIPADDIKTYSNYITITLFILIIIRALLWFVPKMLQEDKKI